MPELSQLGTLLAKTLAPFEDAQPAVKTRGRSSPPPAATIGDRYIIAAPGVGPWSARDNQIAQWATPGRWEFIVPLEGMSAWVSDESTELLYTGIEWSASIGSGDGGERALGTPLNKRMPTRTTTADGQRACDIAVSVRPVIGSRIYVEINGLRIPEVGDATKVGAACYWSRDGGFTALSLQSVIAGDILYWQGSIAGYQLDSTSDVIEFVYEVA